MLYQDSAWFTQKELRVEYLHFLLWVVNKFVVGVSEWGKEISALTFACFCQVPNVLGIYCLIKLVVCLCLLSIGDGVAEAVGGDVSFLACYSSSCQHVCHAIGIVPPPSAPQI
jgi:hypothetical protein